MIFVKFITQCKWELICDISDVTTTFHPRFMNLVYNYFLDKNWVTEFKRKKGNKQLDADLPIFLFRLGKSEGKKTSRTASAVCTNYMYVIKRFMYKCFSQMVSFDLLLFKLILAVKYMTFSTFNYLFPLDADAAVLGLPSGVILVKIVTLVSACKDVEILRTSAESGNQTDVSVLLINCYKKKVH